MRLVVLHARALTVELGRHPAYVVPTLLFPAAFFIVFAAPGPPAFAGAPRLVVLDEPTAGLDGDARRTVWQAVRDQVRDGGAVLLTTHHLDEAEALASRVVLVDGGVVVADSSVAELKRSTGRTRVSFRAHGGTPVAGSVRDGDFVRILTRDGGATVAALVRDGVTLDDLEVRPATLEEAIAAIGGGRA